MVRWAVVHTAIKQNLTVTCPSRRGVAHNAFAPMQNALWWYGRRWSEIIANSLERRHAAEIRHHAAKDSFSIYSNL